MKRLFLLIAVCMIGMVLPQGMLAGVTIDTSTSGKVVVTSENAGDFAAYLNSASNVQLNALKVNEIVFVGKFNETDLSTLQAKNCATQKKVDMAEAKFIKSASSASQDYILYKTTSDRDNSQANEGNLCIVEGKLWKKDNQSAAVVSWVPATEDDYNSAPQNGKQDATNWFDDSNKESNNNSVSNGYYYKVPVSGNSAPFIYYKVEKSLGWSEKTYNNGDTKNNPTLFADEDEMNADTSAPDHSEAIVGGTVYKYTNGSWQPVTSSGDGEYDYTQMKFSYWGSNVEEIITSQYAEGPMAQQLCNNCSNLKTLTLSAGDFTGSKLGNNITHLETVNIQNQVTALGSGMFNQAGKEGTGNDATQHLTTVTFQDGCQIKTLPESVFAETGVTSITIPSSVELIEKNAFHTCQSLETVTFVNTNPNPLVIKNNAFQQSDHIKDIYLNVNPSERLLICEYNAFDYHSMEGQTAEGSEMATLHFAEENFDYYAGEWKKGMAFSQSELNAFKDGIEIKDENGQVKYAKPNTQDPNAWSPNGYAAIESYGDRVDGYYHDTNNWNTKYAPANGWQQFAKTASDREIEITGNVYMTYSTDKPYSLPKGIVAFRVTDYKYAVKNAKGYDTNGTLILKAIEQVPTETGMLLISTSDYVIKTSDVNANPNVQSVFYFGDPDGEPAKYHYTMGEAGDATSNYLAPAVHGIAVGPVSQDNPDAKTGAINVNGRPFTHRNFAMHKTSHQFVRLTHCTMPDNRAFLSLPITKFDNPDEGPGEGPTPTQTIAGLGLSLYDGYDPQPTSQGAKAALVFDYDVEKYGMIWPLIKDEGLTGVTTGIKNVNVETVQEGIYTLQGVKVSAPSTKGIYIVNGKKVIIK